MHIDFVPVHLLCMRMEETLYASVDILFCYQHWAIDIFFVCSIACRFRCCAGVHATKARGLFRLSALHMSSADIVYIEKMHCLWQFPSACRFVPCVYGRCRADWKSVKIGIICSVCTWEKPYGNGQDVPACYLLCVRMGETGEDP